MVILIKILTYICGSASFYQKSGTFLQERERDKDIIQIKFEIRLLIVDQGLNAQKMDFSSSLVKRRKECIILESLIQFIRLSIVKKPEFMVVILFYDLDI